MNFTSSSFLFVYFRFSLLSRKFDQKLLFLACPDVALAQVETEKKLSIVKAWEESEKAKAENK